MKTTEQALHKQKTTEQALHKQWCEEFGLPYIPPPRDVMALFREALVRNGDLDPDELLLFNLLHEPTETK